MSKEDIKKEFKDQEGDPHVKSERKQLQQKLLQEAAAKRVPEAKAVIINPTHIAVAIDYDEHSMNAPRLAAKGLNADGETYCRDRQKTSNSSY